MINEEKVRNCLILLFVTAKAMTAVCRNSPQATTDGTIYGKRA